MSTILTLLALCLGFLPQTEAFIILANATTFVNAKSDKQTLKILNRGNIYLNVCRISNGLEAALHQSDSLTHQCHVS